MTSAAPSDTVRVMRGLLIVFTISAAVIAMNTASGFANAGPYSGSGYDASSFQCTNGAPNQIDPAFNSFGIVRVTGGRPFTVDSCRQALWSEAVSGTTSAPSLYVNVAFSNAYGKQVSGACASATSPEGYTGKYLNAYRIGCAESQYAFGHMSTGSITPKAWWLDVETGNSWSSSDKHLNEAAIQGAADELKSLSGVPIGVYSFASSWNTITTGSSFAPASASASWVAGAANCSSSFSSGLTEWLRQSGMTSTGADADYAC